MYVPKKKWRFSSQPFWHQGVFCFLGKVCWVGSRVFFSRVNNLKFSNKKRGESCFYKKYDQMYTNSVGTYIFIFVKLIYMYIGLYLYQYVYLYIYIYTFFLIFIYLYNYHEATLYLWEGPSYTTDQVATAATATATGIAVATVVPTETRSVEADAPAALRDEVPRSETEMGMEYLLGVEGSSSLFVLKVVCFFLVFVVVYS